MVADSLILVVAIVPLALVGVARALWWPAGETGTGGKPGTREARYQEKPGTRPAAAVRVVRAVAGRGGDHRGRHLVAAAAGDPRRRWLHRAPDPVQPGHPGHAWGSRRDHRGQPAGAVRRQLRRPALRSRRRVRRAPPRGSRAGGLGAGPDAPPVRLLRADRPGSRRRHRCQPGDVPVQQLLLGRTERPGDRAGAAVRGGPGRALAGARVAGGASSRGRPGPRGCPRGCPRGFPRACC